MPEQDKSKLIRLSLINEQRIRDRRIGTVDGARIDFVESLLDLVEKSVGDYRFPDFGEHIYGAKGSDACERITIMAYYASIHIVEEIKLEHKYIGLAIESMSAQTLDSKLLIGLNSHEVQFNIDDIVHTIIAKLSTMISNLYNLSVACLLPDQIGRPLHRYTIQRELTANDFSELADHFKGAFGSHSDYRDFDRLRNFTLHAVPKYEFVFPENTSFPFKSDKRPGITYKHNGEKKSEPLYAFLFQMYKHILDSTYQAVEIMLKSKHQTSHSFHQYSSSP